MNHADHVALLAGGVAQGEGGTWADLGAGTGAFTLALADLIGPHGVIHAIDRDRASLAELRSAFVSAVPQAELRVQAADFTRPLDLADLDGIVMANSLHFVEDKTRVLALVRGYLKHGGRLILVEYDSDRGNGWVPPSFVRNLEGARERERLCRYPKACDRSESVPAPDLFRFEPRAVNALRRLRRHAPSLGPALGFHRRARHRGRHALLRRGSGLGGDPGRDDDHGPR